MKHLLDIQSLSDSDLTQILDLAERFRTAALANEPVPPMLAGHLVVNLFLEASTRTRVSFEVAAKRLGADVVNLSASGSSVEKGESLKDTYRTIEAMGPSAVIVRHPDPGAPESLAKIARPGVAILNAGDGAKGHPSQALLDALTLRRAIGDFSGKRLVIAGDIAHSRVAASNMALLPRLGLKSICLSGPAELMPETLPDGIRAETDFDRAIEGADVVMMLRIQRERLGDTAIPNEADYHQRWGLDQVRLDRLGPTALVMHPGPMNRGVEITSEVADGPQSLITEQVANGVAVRMALLTRLLAKRWPELASEDLGHASGERS